MVIMQWCPNRKKADRPPQRLMFWVLWALANDSSNGMIHKSSRQTFSRFMFWVVKLWLGFHALLQYSKRAGTSSRFMYRVLDGPTWTFSD